MKQRSSRQLSPTNGLETLKMMDWFPIVFFTFKILVLGTGMFFAIKWHYDKEKKEKEKRRNNETGAAQAPAKNTLVAPDQSAPIQ